MGGAFTLTFEDYIDAPQAVTEVALDGRFLRSNRALCQLLGYSEPELCELRVRQVTHPDDRSHSVYIVDTALRHYEQSQEELKRYVRKDGSVVWVLLRTTLKRDSSGEPTHFLSFLDDVTQRVHGDPLARVMARRLQTIQEQERQRVARELHEELGQVLSVLKVDLSQLHERLPGELQARAKRLGELTSSIMSSVRRLWLGLRPTMLDELGLEAAVDWLLQETCGGNGVRCTLHRSERPLVLDAQSRVGLFRICQEAVALLGGVAGLSTLEVELIQSDKETCVKLEADGEPTSFTAQPGLLAIQDRVELLGGHLRRAPDGQRNEFFVCVPIQSPSSDGRRVPPHWE
jgi:PAS domain S-box-containing protein